MSESDVEENDYPETSKASQFAGLALAMEQALAKRFDMSNVSLQRAIPVVGVLAGLTFLFVVGLLYFRRWDVQDHAIIVYTRNQNCQSEMTRKNLKKRMDVRMRETLLEQQRTKQVKRQIGKELKKRRSKSNVVSTEDDMMADEWLMSKFFESVMPEGTIFSVWSFWSRLLDALKQHHNWICLFTYGSLRYTRVTRYLSVVTDVMLLIFVDTLFYQVLFSDSTCTSLSGVYTGGNSSYCENYQGMYATCGWDNSTALCSTNPPPTDLMFYIVIAIWISCITIFPQAVVDLVLQRICSKRPDLEKYGIDPATWLGSDSSPGHYGSQRKSTLGIALEADFGGKERKEETLVDTMNPTIVETLAFRYFDMMTAEEEATIVFKGAAKFLQDYLKRASFPWRFEDRNDRIEACKEALMTQVGMELNGDPVTLTWMQWLYYRTPQNRIISKILKVRKRQSIIHSRLNAFGRGELDTRDQLLMQNFILEQMSPLKRFTLKKEFFCFDSASPEYIDPIVWCLAWFGLISMWTMIIFLVMAWALQNGMTIIKSWAIQFVFTLIQDVIITEGVRVYVMHVLVLEVMRPQLRQIYNVLNSIALRKLKDVDEDCHEAPEHIRVVQHLSAACRVARTRDAANLPVSQLLMNLDDYDLEMCREMRNASLGYIGFIVAMIPAALAFTYGPVRDVMLDIMIPAVWNAFLAINNVLYEASVWALIAPYAAIFAFALYIYLIRKPARKRHPTKTFVSGMETKTLKGWMETTKHYKTGQHPLYLPSTWLRYLSGVWYEDAVRRKEARTVDFENLWRNMNLSHVLHAKILVGKISLTSRKNSIVSSQRGSIVRRAAGIETDAGREFTKSVLEKATADLKDRLDKWTVPTKELKKRRALAETLDKARNRRPSNFPNVLAIARGAPDLSGSTRDYKLAKLFMWKEERTVDVVDPDYTPAKKIFGKLDIDDDGKLSFNKADFGLFASWYLSFQRPGKLILEDDVIEMVDHLASQFEPFESKDNNIKFTVFLKWFKNKKFLQSDYTKLYDLACIMEDTVLISPDKGVTVTKDTPRFLVPKFISPDIVWDTLVRYNTSLYPPEPPDPELSKLLQEPVLEIDDKYESEFVSTLY